MMQKTGRDAKMMAGIPQLTEEAVTCMPNLKLSQTNEVYSIRVDGSLIHQESIAETKIWDNVNVVFGNLYDYQDDNHISAEGQYQNFEINSCHNEIQN